MKDKYVRVRDSTLVGTIDKWLHSFSLLFCFLFLRWRLWKMMRLECHAIFAIWPCTKCILWWKVKNEKLIWYLLWVLSNKVRYTNDINVKSTNFYEEEFIVWIYEVSYFVELEIFSLRVFFVNWLVNANSHAHVDYLL